MTPFGAPDHCFRPMQSPTFSLVMQVPLLQLGARHSLFGLLIVRLRRLLPRPTFLFFTSLFLWLSRPELSHCLKEPRSVHLSEGAPLRYTSFVLQRTHV